MWRITIGFGVVLLLLGVASKRITGTESNSPIYATLAFGLPLIVCGLLASKDHLRKHAMHVAAMVGLVGVVAAVILAGRNLLTLLSGGTPMRIHADGTQSDATGATITTTILGVICLVFVGLCINSFVQARLARSKQPQV